MYLLGQNIAHKDKTTDFDIIWSQKPSHLTKLEKKSIRRYFKEEYYNKEDSSFTNQASVTWSDSDLGLVFPNSSVIAMKNLHSIKEWWYHTKKKQS